MFNLKDKSLHLKKRNNFDGNLIYGAKRFHELTKRIGPGRPSSGGLVREAAKVIGFTGLKEFKRKKECFEPVEACPVCGSSGRKPLLTRLAFDYYRCAECRHGFMDPRIKYHKIVELYKDDLTASEIYNSPEEIKIDKIKYQFGLELIEIFLKGKEKKSIMDIGCGTGLFLEIAYGSGWQNCIGLDPNKNYSAGYKNINGLQFINSDLESIDPSSIGSDYDCISFWGVLEHLYDLHDVLSVVRKALRPGGLIFTLVPNLDSLATRLIREKSATFNWKHVSCFCAKSLELLMKKHSFRKRYLETVITEIGNIRNYLNFDHPYEGNSKDRQLFPFITSEFIHDNLLGSRLMGIFQKE